MSDDIGPTVSDDHGTHYYGDGCDPPHDGRGCPACPHALDVHTAAERKACLQTVRDRADEPDRTVATPWTSSCCPECQEVVCDSDCPNRHRNPNGHE